MAALETAAPELVKAAWDGGARCVEDPERTLQLLVELQALGDAVLVEWPEGETFRVRREVGSGALTVSVRAAEDWFSATGRLAVDDDLVLELTELLALVEGSRGRFVRLEDGGFLALTEALRRQLDALARISRTRKGRTEFHGLAAGVVAPLVAGAGRRRTDAAWKAQLRRIEAADAADVPLPNTLQAELRPYQRDGFAWLTRLSTWGAGACLADDMGLGKTVQALALLLTRAAEGPALVVAPASVCGTWCEEAWRFAPSLAVHRFGPGDRKALLDGLGASDVVVCSYGLLTSEVQRLSAVRWATVVLDEAQAIKNPKTRRHRAVLKLSAACRLATTGTPVENHLGELWALFSFLNPGLLGSWERFRTRFAAPIEEGDREVGAQLRQIMLPFILRRTKSAVLAELPPRTDVQITVEPGEAEAALYEALRRRAIEELEAADEEPRPLQILAQLTRLRLACCNPRLVVDHDDAPPSAKLAAFEQIVEGLRASRHRALVFSQFVRHLALLREWLDRRGIPYLYLDGSTPVARRDELVRAFQSGEGELFLISLRAGGLGLNLTGADHVVHMDPWWNPAVEDQASDRAHRIGQTRPVTVYRLVAKGTVEERIVALHHHKRDLADRLLADADTAARLSAADLLAVLRGE